jgi:alkanesulfonate monooxygenase SsuD/methylene tetrahydromethanopterin reductase-like flavin-dependent oxidoreductase (luciferase family)
MGHEPRARVGRMEESLALLERLWTGEAVTFAGKHFRLDGVRLSMRPLQRPRPPLWLAADADAGVRRAARLGDTWLLNAHATLPTLERQWALFAAVRREAGRPPADEIPLKRECFVAPDDATALREGAPFIDEKYAAYRRWGQDAALPPGESFSADVRELMRDRFLVGDPARVREEIARYRERLGITTLIVRVQWPGMAQATVLRTIRLLGEQVLPAFA